MRLSRSLLVALVASAVVLAGGAGGAAPSSGPHPSHVVKAARQIQGAVQRFRYYLGPDNGTGPGHFTTGRREINWDGVPDDFSRPHGLPSDFFNGASAPRARGALLLTPGSSVAVSADSDNPAGAAVRFGDVNPTYSRQFKTFSPERLFSPIGSNVVNLYFRVPGTNTHAAVRGFGAVYTDIDRRENTAFEYFDSHGHILGKFKVPPAPSGLSFLGVVYHSAVVAHVRIKYGNRALGPNDSKRYDVAVMDDFIYGEPVAVSK